MRNSIALLCFSAALAASPAGASPAGWALLSKPDGSVQAGLKPSEAHGDLEFLVSCKPGAALAEIEFRSTNEHGGPEPSASTRDASLIIEVNGKSHGPVKARLVYDEPDAAWHFVTSVETSGWLWRELAEAQTIVMQSPDRTVAIPMEGAPSALAAFDRACRS